MHTRLEINGLKSYASGTRRRIGIQNLTTYFSINNVMGSIISHLPSVDKPTASAIIASTAGGIYFFADKMSESSMKVLHLGSYSIWFGTQFWVTFVAGAVMFYALPRQMFGLVQSKLFPKYFLSGMGMTSITLATYMARNPFRMWSGDSKIQGWLLATILASNMASCYIVEPLTTAQMFRCHKYEREHGEKGQEVGVSLSKGLEQDKTYMELRGKFYRLHGISSLVNMVSLGCSCAYLWYLQKGLNW
eukprot:Seg1268.10 transcript_id=Seg1268.10/GoldUCD/mRNA.D3Y31 product="Transmembrane protein 205" protein_id=Seg1268.10/GoldUCD/D3Y31